MAIQRDIKLIETLVGHEIPKTARILDFGCGSGKNVYVLLDQGFTNVSGYDVRDCLELRDEADRRLFQVSPRTNLRLPFDDNTFDLIFSDQVFEHVKDQVTVFAELHRITKPGGHHLHAIPAPYYPIERHLKVPFGNLIVSRWWFKLWALLGVRNKHQKGLSADETVERNLFFVAQALNYTSNSCYAVVWNRIGLDHQFAEQAFFDTHRKKFVRWLGRLNRALPVVGWGYRTFQARYAFLTKRA